MATAVSRELSASAARQSERCHPSQTRPLHTHWCRPLVSLYCPSMQPVPQPEVSIAD